VGEIPISSRVASACSGTLLALLPVPLLDLGDLDDDVARAVDLV
jgi:hypothetical protein